ncbi:bifunctional folylpolyglutamate synthase/dihydrofolate synthase [Petrocella sp. FN5]|uniref:bifunctional folylpolyglutamate synthase/dihydrofolate synthase n=1 Tax=Petrocella sp. FN5 TaxID=3032002 RepID=UPI0023DBFE4D|nr:Mur ligase family protein [Petrocella sp. FN5]MDF1617705.1 Mur ligase family protein [Petrocella sp. FN5]
MTYQDSLNALKNIEVAQYRPDHNNSLHLMTYLDSPQNTLPVIHIAGTNGKGSTAKYLQNILTHADYKVGTFLSPHILDYKELIEDYEGVISESDFAKSTDMVLQACNCMVDDHLNHPTLFECLVAIALVHFSHKKHDFIIIEVGMGGTYDATNVFDKPLMTIITPISYDHEAYLGSSLEAIAAHKAGIIKADAPVIMAPNPIEVVIEVTKKVKEVDTYLYLLDESLIQVSLLFNSFKKKLFNIQTPFFAYKGLSTTMIGKHQEINIATALLAIHELKKKWSIPDAAVKSGIANTHWTCRNEWISYRPMILLDGGHNPHGLLAVKEILETYCKHKTIITVIGILKDKNYKAMLNLVDAFSQKVIMTSPLSPRAMTLDDLDLPQNSNLEWIDPFEKAIEKGLSLLNQDSILLITGSLYLAYPAKAWLEENL